MRRLLVAVLGVLAMLGADVAHADCPRPATGLVAHWPGEDTTQDVAGGHDGVLHGDGGDYENGHIGRAFSLPGNEERAINAIWSYEEPSDAVASIREHLAFYPDRVRIDHTPD